MKYTLADIQKARDDAAPDEINPIYEYAIGGRVFEAYHARGHWMLWEGEVFWTCQNREECELKILHMVNLD